MADIDMIPREYRDGVRVRRTLRLAGIALGVVLALGALGGIGLRWRLAAIERATVALQTASTQAQADGVRDAALQAGQARREQDAAILRTLRRKGELAALAQGLDAALGEGVWLTGLRLERDIQAVSPAAGAAAAPTVAPSNDPGEEFTAASQSWRLKSSVDLTGQAVSYEAATAFLSALGRQPGIANLRLVSSSAAGAGTDTHIIDFHASGTLAHKGTPP